MQESSEPFPSILLIDIKMLKAVIFDMDGLLVDSEPLWKEAEQKIFSRVSIELTYDMMAQTA